MKKLLYSIRQHESELHAFILPRAESPAVADDLTQEVFLRAIAQGERFTRIENPRAWLFRVARNVLIDHVRCQRPTAQLPDDLALADTETDTVDLLTECVGRNLARLNAADRDIIECCDLKQQTVKDYAQQKNLSLPAAKSRLLRARQRLRDSIVLHCSVSFDEQGKVNDYQVPPAAQSDS